MSRWMGPHEKRELVRTKVARKTLIALSQIAGFCELDCKVSVADFTEMGFTESGFTETEFMVSV
jgi:hypothetical protein